MLTASDVAKYAVSKLKIKATTGHEKIALDGYLQGAKPDSDKIVEDKKTVHASDTATKLWGDK